MTKTNLQWDCIRLNILHREKYYLPRNQMTPCLTRDNKVTGGANDIKDKRNN